MGNYRLEYSNQVQTNCSGYVAECINEEALKTDVDSLLKFDMSST